MGHTEAQLRELLESLEVWMSMHKSTDGYPMEEVRTVFGRLVSARDKSRLFLDTLDRLRSDDGSL